MRLTIASGERRELICPSCQLVADIFACDVGQITGTSSRVPCPIRGALAIVTNVGRDAVDAFVARDECTKKRTAKSCGPDISTLMSSGRRCFGIAACDGGKKARSPGSNCVDRSIVQLATKRVGSHFWRRAIMVLRMTMSLRMQATSATFGFFPLAIRRR
jgi:hypothetical protein